MSDLLEIATEDFLIRMETAVVDLGEELSKEAQEALPILARQIGDVIAEDADRMAKGVVTKTITIEEARLILGNKLTLTKIKGMLEYEEGRKIFPIYLQRLGEALVQAVADAAANQLRILIQEEIT